VFERWLAEPFTVLYGSAGVGKTALIEAAAARLATSSGGSGRIVLGEGRITPPDVSWPAHHNPFTQALLDTWASAETPRELAGLSIAGFLRRLRPSDQPNIFAAIDQVESLFLDPSHDQYARDFLQELVEAVRLVPGVHALVSVREDYLPELAVLEREFGRSGRYRLAALGPDAALEAVAGQLRGGGRSFDPEVAEEVVRNLRTSRLTDVLGESRQVVADTVEPAQLRATCSALLDALPSDVGNVSLAQLYGPGDLDGGLVHFCERSVRKVAGAHALSEHELSGWLARTFVTDRGARGMAYEGVADVAGMPHDVVHQLVDRHVLSAERHLGSRWFQLPNDRLIAPVLESAGLSRTDRPSVVSSAASSLAAAEGALAEGQLTLAAQCASEAVRTSGGNDPRVHASALSCLGQVAAESGHDQQAESYYGAAAALFEALHDQAGSGRLLAELGRILLRRGSYAEAVAKLQGAETRLPSDINVRVDLARALRDSGQLWAATAVLGAALTVAPGTVEALVERGLIRIETGEFSSALEDLDNAIRLQPSVGRQSKILSARQVAHAHLNEPA